MALPDPIGGKLLLGAIYAAYTTGYMLDSAFNKDPNPVETHHVQRSIKELVNKDELKKANDILHADRDL